SPALLQRLQRSTVRFNNTASGSFVAKDGLILTNHHVMGACIAALSTAHNDLLEHGFVAATWADERRCPATEVTVLAAIDDVSARVADAGAADQPAVIRRIEQDCAAAWLQRCEVISLYGGAAHHLYRSDRYDDVRLVFAPEA